METRLIIHTDQYSGNFNREMTHFITGAIGECETKCDIPFDESEVFDRVPTFMVMIGEDRCDRPCEIYPTPGYFNNGLGGEFKDGDEEAALEHYNQECIKYTIDKRTEVKKYPCYMSVCIFMETELTDDDLKVIEERANRYAALYQKEQQDFYRKFNNDREIPLMKITGVEQVPYND